MVWVGGWVWVWLCGAGGAALRRWPGALCAARALRATPELVAGCRCLAADGPAPGVLPRREQLVGDAGRHRFLYQPKDTPPEFWNMNLTLDPGGYH